MAADFSDRFYHSKQWKQCRASYISKVYGLCERCQAPGTELHHKIALTPTNISDPNVTLNHSNLELLCFSCHQRETHGASNATRDGLEFNDNGELVQLARK